MIEKVIRFGIFLLMTQTDAETLFYAALMTALELGIFVFFVKYKPLFRIRNWWTVYKLQPSGKFEYKHYVRVIKRTHQPTEFIYEIGKKKMKDPNDVEKLLSTAKIGKDKLHITLKREGSEEPVRLDFNSAYDLDVNGETVRLIYTRIIVFVRKTKFMDLFNR